MIHFSHANGFPSLCYKALFQELEQRESLCFIPIIGHNDQFPITENWSFLIDEVIASIKEQSSEPVVGLGHSLGGVLTLLASFKCPEIFKQVILLDAPMFGFSKSKIIKLIKSLGLIHLVTPSNRSKKRMDSWSSKESLKTYLLAKKIYQNFHPQCLDDYIEFGMEKNQNDHYQLKFNRDKESLIFKTVPHNMHYLARKKKVPISLIYSKTSHIITKLDLMKMKHYYDFKTSTCSGSHLFPLENPKQTADQIMAHISS